MPNEFAELLKKLAEKESEKWDYIVHAAGELFCSKDGQFTLGTFEPYIDDCIDLAEKLGRRIFVCYDPYMEEISVDIYNLSYELQAHLTNLSDEEKADQRKLFEIGLIAVLRDYLKKAGNEGN